MLSRAPATVCLGLLLALAGGVTQFANPLTQVLADRPLVAPILANPAELWSMRADGTNQTRLTRSGTEVANTQSWSADGTNISHSSWRYVADKDPTTAQGVTSSVVIADGAGSPLAEITGDGGWLSGAVWSPSGSDLALNVFHSAPADSSPDAGASGQPNVGLAEPQANAAPAPAAGNVAAFAGIEWDIAIAPATAGGSPHLIDRTPATDIVTDWSPDGGSLLAHSDRGGDFDVYRIDPTSGAATDLTNSPGVDDWAAWSPDGTMIAFTSERSGGSHIWVMDANGSDPKQLTSGSWDDWVPAWSPSGKQLAFLSNRDGQGEIYRMQVDGSQQVNLTQTPTRDEFMTADAWSPDGETILFDAAATTTQDTGLSLPLAAASIIIQAFILVGVLSFAWSRRLLVPGSLTVMLGISFTALSFASGEYEFIAAGIAAGVLIDLALWGWRPRREAPAFFFAVPLIVYGAYFAALQIAGTLGWSLPTVIAFTGLAGVTGLATGLLASSPSPPGRA
jgi:Tol biopolymer transport system component